MENNIISKYFWIACVAVTILNALIMKFRSRKYIARNPSLAAGYQRLFWGSLFWLNVPCVVMGIGILSGNVDSVDVYIKPQGMNYFIVAFYAVIVIEWLLCAYWILCRDGANVLYTHPGMLRHDPKSPTVVKMWTCVMLAAGIMGLTMILQNGHL